jgi:hypothetical protein
MRKVCNKILPQNGPQNVEYFSCLTKNNLLTTLRTACIVLLTVILTLLLYLPFIFKMLLLFFRMHLTQSIVFTMARKNGK